MENDKVAMILAIIIVVVFIIACWSWLGGHPHLEEETIASIPNVIRIA